MVSAHSLAASVRSAQESETFDLAGQSVGTITSIVEAAFREPFALDEMIRLTFIIGAGKQSRQKYDDGAAKAVTSVLDRYGYEDDRGASCVMDCAGSYKMQHDTGKNIKTVVVFPKIAKSDNDGAADLEAEPIIPEDSPGYKLAVSSMAVFTNMVKAKCPSYSQKRGCLDSILALKELVQELDEKLMNGTPLDDSEQSFYAACALLDEKESHVRGELLGMVEAGNITKHEQDLLLEHNAEKIASLEKQNKSTAKALQRKELLESIAPCPPHPLKHEAEIGKLRKELAPLLQVEASAKGRLLTVKETQTLSRKDEILEEIEYWEDQSRGWFEDDAAFESRLETSRKGFANRKSKKPSKAATVDASTKVRMSVNKWVTPGDTKGWSTSTGAKKKGKMKGGAVFSAMMMDSDDDDDDEEDEREEDAEEEVPSEDNVSDNVPVEKAKKKSKKKKKKGKAKQEMQQMETASSQDGTKEEETAVAQAVNILQTHIIPLLVGLLTWLITLVFGKPKPKKKRG